jgi:hypothetical protein
MNYTALGYLFVLVTALFALGLAPRLAPLFYPDYFAEPGLLRRLAAPVLFALLALSCFIGWGLQAFILTAVLGMAQIIVSRWNRQKRSGEI